MVCNLLLIAVDACIFITKKTDREILSVPDRLFSYFFSIPSCSAEF